jgi:hypothetical protein
MSVTIESIQEEEERKKTVITPADDSDTHQDIMLAIPKLDWILIGGCHGGRIISVVAAVGLKVTARLRRQRRCCTRKGILLFGIAALCNHIQTNI